MFFFDLFRSKEYDSKMDSIINNYAKSYLDSIKQNYSMIETEDITIYPLPATDHIIINSSDWTFEKIVSLYLVATSNM